MMAAGSGNELDVDVWQKILGATLGDKCITIKKTLGGLEMHQPIGFKGVLQHQHLPCLPKRSFMEGCGLSCTDDWKKLADLVELDYGKKKHIEATEEGHYQAICRHLTRLYPSLVVEIYGVKVKEKPPERNIRLEKLTLDFWYALENPKGLLLGRECQYQKDRFILKDMKAQIFYPTNHPKLYGIDKSDSKRIGDGAVEMNKKLFKYAWVLDKLKAEHGRNISIDNSHLKFEATDYYYMIDINAFGYRDYIKNMIIGTFWADCIVLILETDIFKDGRARERTLLVFAHGVKQRICCRDKTGATVPIYFKVSYAKIIKVGNILEKILFVPIGDEVELTFSKLRRLERLTDSLMRSVIAASFLMQRVVIGLAGFYPLGSLQVAICFLPLQENPKLVISKHSLLESLVFYLLDDLTHEVSYCHVLVYGQGKQLTSKGDLEVAFYLLNLIVVICFKKNFYLTI